MSSASHAHRTRPCRRFRVGFCVAIQNSCATRYWAYSDQELDNLVTGFHEDDAPLNVLVIDMDRHPTFGQNWWNSTKDASGQTLGWTGLSWNKLLWELFQLTQNPGIPCLRGWRI